MVGISRSKVIFFGGGKPMTKTDFFLPKNEQQKPPKNWCLEDDPASFWKGPFSGDKEGHFQFFLLPASILRQVESLSSGWWYLWSFLVSKGWLSGWSVVWRGVKPYLGGFLSDQYFSAENLKFLESDHLKMDVQSVYLDISFLGKIAMVNHVWHG